MQPSDPFITAFYTFLNGRKERTDLSWLKTCSILRNTSVTEPHAYVTAGLALPIKRRPLSAVLPGTFGDGESDQAPKSTQSTRGSSVRANYSSHLI